MLSNMNTAHLFLLTFLLLPPILAAQATTNPTIMHVYELEEQDHPAEAVALIRPLLDSNTLLGADLGRAWNALGLGYLDQGDFPPAQEAFERAIHILQPIPNSRDYAIVLGNLADLYFSKLDPATALQLRLKALPVFEQQNDHEDIAITCNHLAGIELQLDRKKEGRKYLNRAIQEMNAAPELNGNDRAAISMMEAKFAEVDHEWATAVQSMQSAVSTWQSIFGEDHSNVGWGYILLGHEYQKTGKMADAEREMQHGMSILGRTVSPQSSYYVQAELTYAGLLEKRGDHAAASRLRTAAEAAQGSNRTPCVGCTISVDALR